MILQQIAPETVAAQETHLIAWKATCVVKQYPRKHNVITMKISVIMTTIVAHIVYMVAVKVGKVNQSVMANGVICQQHVLRKRIKDLKNLGYRAKGSIKQQKK